MNTLSEEFLAQCPEKQDFRLRGQTMTRIEVFVDAAFAFAVTMLVISLDQIPTSVSGLLEASKQIPAFIVCVVQMIWIWRTHAVWSQRYGMEDVKTVIYSVSLLIVVLIYIYPLKMMFSGFFAWVTQGFLPSQFQIQSYDDLRNLFVFFAVGFTAIWVIFIAMYQHALNNKEALRLSPLEIFRTQTQVMVRKAIAGIGLIAIITPLIAPDSWVPLAGFSYSLIGIAYPWIEIHRQKIWNRILMDHVIS